MVKYSKVNVKLSDAQEIADKEKNQAKNCIQ